MEGSTLKFFALASFFFAAWLPAPAAWAQKKTTKQGAASGQKAQETKSTQQNAEEEKALLKATQRIQAAHLKELESVAGWSISSGLKDESDKLVQKMSALDPEYPGLSKLKAKLEKCEPLKDEKKLEELRKAYGKKIETANDANAKRLFDLATKCMKFGLFTRAYDLVSAVKEADPDHKKARDILGFAWDAASKSWITKWEAEMRKKCFLTDEGWVEKAHEKDWKAGKREFQGKWIPKEKEEEYRKRNNYNPYTATSEHFEVQTNLGRAKAFQFAGRLEDFYGQFFRYYIGFYDQVAGAQLLFNQTKVKKKHRVFVFPSNVEYLDFVRAEKGNDKLLRESGGFWAGGERRSYFYWTDNPEGNIKTLYHEVTHQLFGETKEESGNSKGNNWVVEGIATYMETWEKVDGKWKPGYNTDHEKLQAAKSFLSAHSDWNLAKYAAIDNKEFHEADRGLNYCLGGALCHFLLHYDNETYREKFITFISAYYGGKVEENSLPKYLKTDFATLEKQFKEYMSRLVSPDQGGSGAAQGSGKE